MKILATFALTLVVAATIHGQTNLWPASGNVGIGTTTPSAKLVVNTGGQYFKVNTYTNDMDVSLTGGTYGYARAYRVGNSGESGNTQQFGAFGVLGGNTGVNFAYIAIPTASEEITGYNATRILMLNSIGNVGVGTTSPTQKLSVSGNIISTGAVIADSSAGFQNNVYLVNASNPIWSFNNAPAYGISYYQDNGAHPIGISGDAIGFSFGTVLSPPFYVKYTGGAYFAGNVGIGTPNPTEKLSVNGKIRAKEVIVETAGWSDYVFKPDYRLVSLSEVEGAIKRDGRLPGVPSAQEVAEKGVSIGNMQAILLAKIEELTLHVIQQEKRLTAQQIEIATLKRENASQRTGQ